MSLVRIHLPDSSVKEFPHEPTVIEVAQSIGPGLAKSTVGALLNQSSEVVDLRTPLKDGTQLRIITLKDEESLEVIRHSAAHVMAQAVQEIWPDVKVTIGPVINQGFFYDFDSPRAFLPEDLEKIDSKIAEILKRDDKVLREVWPKEKAIEVFSAMGETFKVEIINDLNEPEVTIYRQGEWFDLCRGPHVQSLGQIKAIKTLTTAGAYWRGDETRAQLQRIYATAFNDKKDLNKHLENLEEAKKRDHRKLGKELNLFAFTQLSPGAPFFTPKGTIIYRALQTYVREKYLDYGYQEIISPQIYDVELFKQSGHYDNYVENMYFTQVEERSFSVKPMNCPGHCILYKNDLKSYRDLPWRIADFGRLHRHERSGTMHGLTRVRSFCQDDAHIFCTMGQLQSEIQSVMKMLGEIYTQLGMPNYKVYLSTRPEKKMGSDEIWDKAEEALAVALNNVGMKYKVNPGDGAFYGPKIDIVFIDALEREWQLGTLQCDFNMPKAFELKYIGKDNQEHQPVMIHRAILGSFERFIGVYLEHTAGRLATWLSPVQVKILNVTSDQAEYCQSLHTQLLQEGVRVEFDGRNEKLGFKIREAQLQKTPYMLIIGDKEKETGSVSVRLPNGETKSGLPFQDFVSSIKKEVTDRLLVSPWTQL